MAFCFLQQSKSSKTIFSPPTRRVDPPLLVIGFPVVIYSHAQSLCLAMFSFASETTKRAARSGRWGYNTKHRHTRPLSSPTISKDLHPLFPIPIYTTTADLEITSHIGRHNLHSAKSAIGALVVVEIKKIILACFCSSTCHMTLEITI